MKIVEDTILDMSIFVEACKKIAKISYAYQKFQHIEYRTSERRKKMKIVEDTISKIFIYQNNNAGRCPQRQKLLIANFLKVIPKQGIEG